MAVVVMGVSGAGKSTIGQKLADAMKCTFIEADDFHSQYNKDKMRQGIPLTDEDRLPWLTTLQTTLRNNLSNDQATVLGCSALKNCYREVLRSGDESYKQGSFKSKVKFVLLEATAEVLEARLQRRIAEGTHYMPVSLLQSQLDTLEIDDAEGILKVDATLSPGDILDAIQAELLPALRRLVSICARSVLMATIGNRSKEIAMMGKKLVKSRVLGNNSHESTGPASATSSRAIHSSMYDKNPEEYIRPALVLDEVVNSNRSGKYWVPHPETGVFVPRVEQNKESVSKVVTNEGGKTVLEEKAWFRSTGLEDLEKPHC